MEEDIFTLWKRITKEIIFFKIPKYYLYAEQEEAGYIPNLPMDGKRVHEGMLNDLKVVGRTLLELAHLAMNGVPLYMDNRREVIKLVKMLDNFLLLNSQVVKLANYQGINRDDLIAVEFLTESIAKRHQSRVNELEIQIAEDINDILTVPKRVINSKKGRKTKGKLFTPRDVRNTMGGRNG